MSKEFRMERIEKLLQELSYEIRRGLSENEIDENISFTQIHPISRSIPDGVVRIDFRVKPVPRWEVFPFQDEGKLKLVK